MSIARVHSRVERILRPVVNPLAATVTELFDNGHSRFLVQCSYPLRKLRGVDRLGCQLDHSLLEKRSPVRRGSPKVIEEVVDTAGTDGKLPFQPTGAIELLEHSVAELGVLEEMPHYGKVEDARLFSCAAAWYEILVLC